MTSTEASTAERATSGRAVPPARLTSLIGVGLQAYLRKRRRLLGDREYWRAHTARLQRLQLRRLLNTASACEFGAARGFGRIGRMPGEEMLRAYRGEVPIADWYAFKETITRMREGGEPDLLWPGRVMDFAQTSGTTAGDKFIPVSKAMLRSNYRASLDIFSHLYRFGVPTSRLFGGKCLFLGGSSDLAVNEHGIRTGDLSGIVTPLIRWPLSEIYAPGKQIALMSHWPSKIEAMARACFEMDMRMISGMPSWAIVLFERVVQLDAERRGGNRRTIREIWPNLEVFVHGGVKYAPFGGRVRHAFSGAPDGDDIPTRFELYPASEGFIAMQDTPGDPGLRLMCDTEIFYEFVPLEEIDRADARAFTCDQVEKGQRYVVVMSTCAGLWRYIIGDVVEFDTIPGGPDGEGGDGPCRLRIVGRHRHFINAFGENLIVEHIENAVAEASRETGVVVGEFTAAPVYPEGGRRGGLELVVEVDREAFARDSVRFAERFDAGLKSQCVDYATKRTDDLGMVAPTITPVPVGTFHRWLEAKGKLGGQHKCPRCANHREIVAGVLEAARV
ncbi:MAG: GH3 auxin-responsive promoter family protein [Phycisphaeraceae bacterium]|nr:GH3 auxin-responsive promoter family protein [Phycisphaeraceae bacterium]MBX3366076.1 GH3 auxin-responsive promoter family protein [Phycisphaeraceae bacterium]